MTINVTVEHDGIGYDAQVATITGTKLGVRELNGVFGSNLYVKFAEGGGTAVGGYVLDEFDSGLERRVGTELGMEWIAETMRTVGVENWEDLTGARVLVLYPKSESGIHIGQVAVGIANIDTGKAMVFKDFTDQWTFRAMRPASPDASWRKEEGRK